MDDWGGSKAWESFGREVRREGGGAADTHPTPITFRSNLRDGVQGSRCQMRWLARARKGARCVWRPQRPRGKGAHTVGRLSVGAWLAGLKPKGRVHLRRKRRAPDRFCQGCHRRRRHRRRRRRCIAAAAIQTSWRLSCLWRLIGEWVAKNEAMDVCVCV